MAIEEILLGDNDKLSALVAGIIEADILIIASDIDGLYDDNPHLNPQATLITEVKNLDDIRRFAHEKNSSLGTGGMTTKIHAAEICLKNNVEMWIVNGGDNNFVVNALDDKIRFTRFKI